nr:MAG TPA: hypothetical protein [Caudoviricetes sp.]
MKFLQVCGLIVLSMLEKKTPTETKNCLFKKLLIIKKSFFKNNLTLRLNTS